MGVAGTGVDVRIDAPAKNFIEAGVGRGPFQYPGAYLVPGECRQMADIKNERVTKSDRLRQHRLPFDDTEELIGPRPRRLEFFRETRNFAERLVIFRECHNFRSIG